jgi:hypothetical protein
MVPDETAIQRQIRELLTRIPEDRMPDDVRARIESALNAAALDAAGPKRRRWLLPTAAAAAVLIVGVALLPRGTAPAPVLAADCRLTVSPRTDLSPVSHATGRVYTRAGIPDQARELLAQPSNCPTALSAVAAEAAPRAAPEGAAAGLDLTNCLTTTIPGRTVIAVDRAFFGGEAVLITVVAAAPDRAIVVDCTPPPGRVMYRTDLL